MSHHHQAGPTPESAGPEKRSMMAPLNRAELTLTIPQPSAHVGVSMMDMSPAAAGSYQLPSPSFNNFMLTLSPLMQLSSPQATMSPREDGCGLGLGGCVPVPVVHSAMTPMVNTADEIPFAFQPNDAAPPMAPPLPMAPPTAPPTTSRFAVQHAGAMPNASSAGASAASIAPGSTLTAVTSLHQVPHPPAVGGPAVGGADSAGVLAERFHLMQMDPTVVGVPGLHHAHGKEHEPHEVVVVPEDPTAAAAATAAVAATRAFAGEIAELPPASPRPGYENEQQQQQRAGAAAAAGAMGGPLGAPGEEDEEDGGYFSSSSSSDGTNVHALGGTPLDGEDDYHQYGHLGHYASSHLQPQHVSLPQQQGAQQHEHGFPVPPPPSARRLSTGSVSSVGSGSTTTTNSSSARKSSGGSSSSSSRRHSGGNAAARAAAAAAGGAAASRLSFGGNGSANGTAAGGGFHDQSSAQRAMAGLPLGVQGSKRCNCRKSKCLKLYCECFAAGAYCQEGCGCTDCNNSKAFEGKRSEAIQSILSRNPNAFAEKIQVIAPPAFGNRRSVGGRAEAGDETTLVGGPQGPASVPTAAHVRGCNCRKSLCIKKYCECFFAGVYCGENCQCEGCQNTAEFAGTHAARAAARKKGGSKTAAATAAAGAGAGAAGTRGPSPVPPAVAAMGGEDSKLPPPPSMLMPV